METAVRLTTEALTIVGAIASVYLAVGIAVAFVEGQFAAVTGQAGMRANVMYRIGLLVISVAVIAFVNLITKDVVSILTAEAGSAAGIRAAVVRIGVYFVDVLIGLAIVLMAVGVVFGFVDAQLQVVLGQPAGFSTAMSRIAAVVLLGVGALFTITISRIVIGALGG